MTLLSPIWLALSLPLAAWLWRRPLPTRLLTALRATTMGLLVVALAGPMVLLPGRGGTVIVVADRSLSMPPGAESAHREIINLLERHAGNDQRVGVVGFAGDVVLERPAQSGAFAGFSGQIDPHASRLADALSTASAMIEPHRPARILVVSDGRWTGRDPLARAGRLAGRGIAVDYRAVARPPAGDTAIARIEVPREVAPGEGFLLHAWVRSPVGQEIRYELLSGDEVLAAGRRSVPGGLTRLSFRDRAGAAGTRVYHLRVSGADDDPVMENNLARAIVAVRGARPVLAVRRASRSSLPGLLRRAGLTVEDRLASDVDWSLAGLSGYSAVVLENVPSDEPGREGMARLAELVRRAGRGLVMTGGRQSYAPGGYYESPLADVLPVSMELRREHRKLALAICVALDRSGSMSATVGGGRTKMDLANIASSKVLDMLSPMDQFAAIAVDSSPHTVVPLSDVPSDPSAIRSKLLSIRSMGGGIYVGEALKAAVRTLTSAQAGARHIILFADAADAEQPEAYRALLTTAGQAGITCSVIALGSPRDSDADLLRDVARAGAGRCYFASDPRELPRLFLQDTFVVARTSFVEDLTPVRLTPALASLTPGRFAPPPPVGGYNLCYLRPGASLGAVTVDEYQAPLVAFWQAGAGRVACYTGQADGQFVGPIATWEDVGSLHASLVRWAAGSEARLGEGMVLQQDVRHGQWRVELHVDPDRAADRLDSLPSVTVVRDAAGRDPSAETHTLRWVSPDRLEVSLPLRGGQTALASVRAPDGRTVSLAPVCLPYSPEYAPPGPQTGTEALDRLARLTGGTERLDLAGIWEDMPSTLRVRSLAPALLLIAITAFLMEILERRTGLVARAGTQLARAPAAVSRRWQRDRARRRRATRRAAEAEAPDSPIPTAVKPTGTSSMRPAGVANESGEPLPDEPADEPAGANGPPQPQPEPPRDQQAEPSGERGGEPSMRDALRAARDRARKRTGR